MKSRNEHYSCIEIGTNAIKVAICSILPDGSLELNALATRPSLKMLKGEPTNPSIVSEQLLQAMEDATLQAGLKAFPKQAALLLSGEYIHPQIQHRKIDLPSERPISGEMQEEIFRDNGIEAREHGTEAENVMTLVAERIIRLDNERTVFSAIGLYAAQAEFETYYYLYNNASFQHFASVFTQTGYPWQRIKATLYTPLAVASAVFQPSPSDECLGLVIDIGAGMTSIAMPAGPGYVVCEQFAVGCDNIANDLSIVLDLDIASARSILLEMKTLRLTAIPNDDGESRMVDLVIHGTMDNSTSRRTISADFIEQIINVRLSEIFELVKRRLEELDAMKFIGNEVLLSGGGALIPRINELASHIFNRRAKTALPYRHVNGAAEHLDDPRNNAVFGLMMAFPTLVALNEGQDGKASHGLFDSLNKIARVLKW